MSFTPCGSLLEVMSTALDSPVTAHAAREFVAGRLPRTAFLRCLEGSLPDADRQLFRAELEEFPEDLLTVVLEVWSLSDQAGQPFRLKSVIPERPLSLARRRAVVLTVDLSDTGVECALTHVPTRHAAWMRPVGASRVSA